MLFSYVNNYKPWPTVPLFQPLPCCHGSSASMNIRQIITLATCLLVFDKRTTGDEQFDVVMLFYHDNRAMSRIISDTKYQLNQKENYFSRWLRLIIPRKYLLQVCVCVWWFSPVHSFTLKSFQNAVSRYFLKSYFTATTARNIKKYTIFIKKPRQKYSFARTGCNLIYG